MRGGDVFEVMTPVRLEGKDMQTHRTFGQEKGANCRDIEGNGGVRGRLPDVKPLEALQRQAGFDPGGRFRQPDHWSPLPCSHARCAQLGRIGSRPSQLC